VSPSYASPSPVGSPFVEIEAPASVPNREDLDQPWRHTVDDAVIAKDELTDLRA
jgi:hypothetical protein